DFSAEGYFIDASHTEYNEFAGKNVYTAYPWGTELGGGQGSQGGQSSGTYTVRFSSNWGGTMRCYYWKDGESPVQWDSAPEMNVEQQDNGYGETVYIYEVPTAYNMVIFQNGSKQTININTNSQSTNYYAMTEKEGNNYKVGTW
ncbi:MAG: hypothetical protein IJ598_03050, partial [Ruminococcus sp.]|nr:hypothetical protein [Ruminococcus sp.]